MGPSLLGSNVAELLLARECMGTGSLCARHGSRATVKRKLEQWQEADLVEHSSASYCSFEPAPRSTIALCYNCDGTLLASTHGDHTVKIINCATGALMRVLAGHRRTPWVVRFHPRRPAQLVSGSLDHEVRLWDALTGHCTTRHTFGKPIASLAFHESENLLAIACGHKLFMWEYGTLGAAPSIVLRTRRSMRAVHFHPSGLPLVLTAEVQDASPTSDLPSALAQHGSFVVSAPRPLAAAPPPGGAPPSHDVPFPSEQLLAPAAPAGAGAGLRGKRLFAAAGGGTAPTAPGGGGARARRDPSGPHWYTTGRSPFEWDPQAQAGPWPAAATADVRPGSERQQQPRRAPPVRNWDWQEVLAAVAAGQALPHEALSQQQLHEAPSAGLSDPLGAMHLSASPGVPAAPRRGSDRWHPAIGSLWVGLPVAVSTSGGGEVGGPLQPASGAEPGVPQGGSRGPGWVPPNSPGLPVSMVPTGWELPFPPSLFSGGGETGTAPGPPGGASGGWAGLPTMPAVMAAFSAAAWNIIGEEQPPRVRLRLWRFDPGKPAAELESSGALRLALCDAVLCSEMGVHFSPCGRFLAATLACRAPMLPLGGGPGAGEMEDPLRALLAPVAERFAPGGDACGGDTPTAASGSHMHAGGDSLMATSGPAPERIVFEIRVISVDGPDFGAVLRAKRVRAAHCLTSVQFSPAGDHLLLAYGKKHISLLRSLAAAEGRGSVAPLHTILEVLRVSDMALLRVLPSAEDEINAACFHPSPGGGLAYGTKEGRLRVLAHDRASCAHDGAAEPAEAHPTERELHSLRAWVEHQVLGAAVARPGPGEAPLSLAAQHEQRMAAIRLQVDGLQGLQQG